MGRLVGLRNVKLRGSRGTVPRGAGRAPSLPDHQGGVRLCGSAAAMSAGNSGGPQPSFVTLRRFGCAGLAGGLGAALTNPVEILRVRFQVESLETRPASIFSFAKRMLHEEGFVGGFARPGLTAWMAAMGFAFSGRMAVYEPLREGIEAAVGCKGGTPATAFAAGLATGAISNAAACPFFNAKALLQSKAASASEPAGGTLAALATVSRSGGLAGHYRGVTALFLRGGMISAGQLAGYDAGASAGLDPSTSGAHCLVPAISCVCVH